MSRSTWVQCCPRLSWGTTYSTFYACRRFLVSRSRVIPKRSSQNVVKRPRQQGALMVARYFQACCILPLGCRYGHGRYKGSLRPIPTISCTCQLPYTLSRKVLNSALKLPASGCPSASHQAVVTSSHQTYLICAYASCCQPPASSFRRLMLIRCIDVLDGHVPHHTPIGETSVLSGVASRWHRIYSPCSLHLCH